VRFGQGPEIRRTDRALLSRHSLKAVAKQTPDS
jgi:hypothetical protein